MRQRCNTCQGEYDTIGADGSSYFHACPPETLVSVRRGTQRLEVLLSDVRPDDVVSVQRAGATIDVPAAETAAGDIRMGDRTRPRAEGRNENIDPRARPGVRAILAEGRGASPVRL